MPKYQTLYNIHTYTYIYIHSQGVQLIFLIKEYHYKTRLRETVFVPNMSVTLQTTLVAKAYLVEEQFLLQQ
jgi:hypothetical protein